MQPLRVVLTCLGGVVALAGLMALVHYGSIASERQAARPAKPVRSIPQRHRLAAYYRVSLN